MLTETFLTSSVEVSGFVAEHELAIKGDRGRPSGGISILVKPTQLPIHTLYKNTHALTIETRYLNIICVYFPPNTPASSIVADIAECTQHISQKDKPTILGGDFNARIDIQTNKFEILNEHLEQMGFIMESNAEMKTYICHNGSSTIDLVYVRHIAHTKITYAEMTILEGFRKHQPLHITFQINKKTAHKEPVKPKVKSLDIHKFNVTTQIIKNNMRNLLTDHSIDHVVEEVNTLFHKYSRNKTHKSNTRSAKYFDEECKAWRYTMLYYKNNIRVDKSWSQWYTIARKIYHIVVENKKRIHIERQHLKLVEQTEQIPYLYLKHKHTGVDIPNALSTAQMESFLVETFSKPNTTIELQNTVAVHCSDAHCNTHSCYLNRPIEDSEVEHAIQKLKANKAPGPDGITNNAIKQAKDTLIPLYSALFSEILETGTLPSQWKVANMKLLYKGKGPKTDPANYRTLSMENTQMKLLASIVNTRISTHIEENLPDEQYGFRKHRSTTDAVNKLLGHIEEARQQNKPLYTVFIDFSQAFNLMNRTQALSKMYTRFNIHGNILKVMKSFLEENTLQINTDDEQIRITQNIGTPQGDCLSSTNFIIDTADLYDVLRDTGCQIGGYADDIAFYHSEIEPVHTALKKLHAWCLENGMVVNTGKTKAMKFRRGGPLKTTDIFKYNTQTLEVVNKFTYLGITFQSSGTTFTQHIEKRLSQLFLEMYRLKDIHTLSIHTALQLFFMKLSPIMEYGIISMWKHLNTTNMEKIDTALARYLKHICRVPKCARNRILYLICDTPTYTNFIKHKYKLSATDAYTKYTQRLNEKMQDINVEIFLTPAMTQQMWKDCLQTTRHAITRHAVHGFHHHICTRQTYHQADQQCTCRLCGQHATQYHLLHCTHRTLSLTQYADMPYK